MCKFILLITIVYIFITNVFCDCPEYCNRKHEDRSNLLSQLPYTQKMNNISLPGTYISAGYEGSYTFENQYLNLSEQLKYGIRVFDFGIRPTSNRFALHNRVYFLNIMFGHALNIFNEFLEKHPDEFVIAIVRQIHSSASDVDINNCEILNRYYDRFNVVKKWSLDGVIGMYRGYILLATIGDEYGDSFSKCITDLRQQCKLSSSIDRNLWSDENFVGVKFMEMMSLQEASFTENYKCFINIIANYYEEKSLSELIAVRSSYSNVYCQEPINYQMSQRFRNPHRAMVIILADFPTQELIDRIIDSNLVADPSVV